MLAKPVTGEAGKPAYRLCLWRLWRDCSSTFLFFVMRFARGYTRVKNLAKLARPPIPKQSSTGSALARLNRNGLLATPVTGKASHP